MNVSVVGATGYAGIELTKLLINHPCVDKYTLYSSSKVNTKLFENYPHFQGVSEHALVEINHEQLIESSDVIFLATPAGVSSEITPSLLEANKKIIDLSGDFRIKEPALYEQWYKRKAAPNKYLEKAVYGLPELYRSFIQEAAIVANPGCYPTATVLGLYPLLKEMKIDVRSIIIDAKSGVSGAGRNGAIHTSYAETNENFRIYKVNEHQHIPEIEQTFEAITGVKAPIAFSTHLVPMTRGIMATMYCRPLEPISETAILDLYKTVYEKERFVRVRKAGQFPATKDVLGSNFCDIGVAYDQRTGLITIVSVIDNLQKGAAGQAIQNFNAILGVDEATGLLNIPLFP